MSGLSDNFIRIDPSQLVPWAHIKIEDADQSKGHDMSAIAYCQNYNQGRSKKTVATFNIVVNKKKLMDLVDKNEKLAKIGARNIYIALVLHEIAHIKYGSFVGTLSNLTQIQGYVFNLLEDIRIEYNMGYELTSLTPFMRLLNTLLKADAGKITVKDGIYESERDLFNSLLNSLYDFARFGLIPEGKHEREFVNFAFPYVLTAERGSVSDAVNSTISICTKLDAMLIDSALTKPEDQRPKFVKETGQGQGAGGAGGTGGTGSGGSAPGAPKGPKQSSPTGVIDNGETEESETADIDISEGFTDQTGQAVFKPGASARGALEMDEEQAARIEADEKELSDTFQMDEDEEGSEGDGDTDDTSSGPKLEVDFSEGEAHPFYDPELKRTPAPMIATESFYNEDELDDLSEKMDGQSSSSFVNKTAKDFLDDVDASDGQDPVRLPGMSNRTWENQKQSRNIGGGAGTDVEVEIVGESNETFFYRATVEERIGTIGEMRRAMREMFRRPYMAPAVEGDMNPMRQQQAYFNSIIGEDGMDYNVRRFATRSLDVAILRDISGSTCGVMREYAEAVVVFLESLEGIEDVRTGVIDFESNFVVTKRFNEPLRSSRIFPVCKGGTELTGSLREIGTWDWKANNRICVILTDGGLGSYGLAPHLKKLEDMNVKVFVVGIGYTAPLPGIPLFMSTVESLPSIMGTLVKGYVINNRIPTSEEMKKYDESA